MPWRPNDKIARWRTLAEKWSRQTGCPAALILATIQQESGGAPEVTRYEPEYERSYCGKGSKGALIAAKCGITTKQVATSYGLMQLMLPLAWGYMSEADKGPGVIAALLDPDKNIRYGAAHLGALHTKHWRYIYRLPFARTGKPNKCFVRDKWW